MDKDFVITPEQIKNTSQEESPHFVTPMRNEIFNNGTPDAILQTPTQNGIELDRCQSTVKAFNKKEYLNLIGQKSGENLKPKVQKSEIVTTSSFEKQHKEEKNTLLLKTQKSTQSQNIKKSKKLKKKQQEAAAEGPE